MAGQAASPGGFRHTALLHENPEEFAEGVLNFVRTGVRAHEPVLVAAPGPGLHVLRAQLDGEGELVSWADLGDLHPEPGGVASLMRSFALRHAGRPVRFVQEAVWAGRAAADVAEALRQETLINQAFARVPAAILCAYETRAEASALAGAESAHPWLLRSGRAQPSSSYTAGRDDWPLSRPPASAMVLTYREDQSRARRAAAECARAAGLDENRVQDVVLAIGELTGNTLKHTGGPGTLTMWTAGGELLGQVDDSGYIRGPLPGTRRDPAGLVGQGLWLVYQLCELVELRTGPGGTSIRIHVRIRS